MCMDTRIDRLMHGPRHGMAAMHRVVSRHRMLTSTATFAAASGLALVARHRRTHKPPFGIERRR